MTRRLTVGQRAERAMFQEDQVLRLSPAARYYPVYRPPTLEDGTLDVRAWCRDLDAWFNAGLAPAAVLDGVPGRSRRE